MEEEMRGGEGSFWQFGKKTLFRLSLILFSVVVIINSHKNFFNNNMCSECRNILRNFCGAVAHGHDHHLLW